MSATMQAPAPVGAGELAPRGIHIPKGCKPSKAVSIGQALNAKWGCRMEFVGPLRPIWITPLTLDYVGVALQMPIRLT